MIKFFSIYLKYDHFEKMFIVQDFFSNNQKNRGSIKTREEEDEEKNHWLANTNSGKC